MEDLQPQTLVPVHTSVDMVENIWVELKESEAFKNEEKEYASEKDNDMFDDGLASDLDQMRDYYSGDDDMETDIIPTSSEAEAAKKAATKDDSPILNDELELRQAPKTAQTQFAKNLTTAPDSGTPSKSSQDLLTAFHKAFHDPQTGVARYSHTLQRSLEELEEEANAIAKSISLLKTDLSKAQKEEISQEKCLDSRTKLKKQLSLWSC